MSSTKRITYTALFASLICLATAFLKIPMPLGYIHLGDGFILIAASCIGPLAIPAAGIGSAIADLLAGYPHFALPTLLIKGLVAFCALKLPHPKCAAPIRFLLAELVMVLGYFIAEIFMYDLAASIAEIPFNLIQGISGLVMGIIFIKLPINVKL